MWDMKTGRSRGYGFVAFRERQDAEKALSSMDGEWLGSRAIRCNWANQKGQPSISAQSTTMGQMGMTPTTPFGHHHFPTHGMQSYDMIVTQTPQWQTTCYVGNLTPYTTQNDLVPLFQNFGFVVETRFQADRGFAFVKMDSHENAAMAICQLSGYSVNGRPLKCSWGKDKAPTQDGFGAASQNSYSPQSAQGPGYSNTPSAYFPQYAGGMPQGGPPSAGGPMAAQSPASYGAQQGGYGGPPQQSPAGYGGAPMYGGPASAGGYGRGGQTPNTQQWTQPAFGGFNQAGAYQG